MLICLNFASAFCNLFAFLSMISFSSRLKNGKLVGPNVRPMPGPMPVSRSNLDLCLLVGPNL